MRRFAITALSLAFLMSGAQAQEGSAEEQQEALWRQVSAQPYQTLPELGTAGFGSKRKRDTLAAFNKKLLRKSFDCPVDARPNRSKVFHPFGTVAKVVFEPATTEHSGPTAGLAGHVDRRSIQALADEQPAHPYTGMFATGGPGLVRLSLANDDNRYIPGVALKLFAQGAPSVNILAIPSFKAQQSSNFFLRAPTNVLPGVADLSGFDKISIRFFIAIQRRAVPEPLALALDPVAAIDATGEKVTNPKAPFQVYFRPAAAETAPQSTSDFRTLIAESVPAGTVIYTLHARERDSDEEVLLGSIRTTSRFVASAFGDKELHFVHHEWKGRLNR